MLGCCRPAAAGVAGGGGGAAQKMGHAAVAGGGCRRFQDNAPRALLHQGRQGLPALPPSGDQSPAQLRRVIPARIRDLIHPGLPFCFSLSAFTNLTFAETLQKTRQGPHHAADLHAILGCCLRCATTPELVSLAHAAGCEGVVGSRGGVSGGAACGGGWRQLGARGQHHCLHLQVNPLCISIILSTSKTFQPLSSAPVSSFGAVHSL